MNPFLQDLRYAFRTLRRTPALSLVIVASLAIGIGAAALTRVMATLLFGVSTTDASTFFVVPLVLILTAMVASYVPALRATRVDPVVALRDE